MATATDHWYLLVRDRENGTTRVTPYRSDTEAFAAYVTAEDEVVTAATEVVLIQAESEAALRSAYPHYFAEGTRDQRLRRFIADLDVLPA